MYRLIHAAWRERKAHAAEQLMRRAGDSERHVVRRAPATVAISAYFRLVCFGNPPYLYALAEQERDDSTDDVTILAMRGRLDELAQTVNGHTQRFDAVDKRFDAVDKRFDALERAYKIESEAIRELVQKTAEGFGATLERIERALDESRREWNEKFGVHDHALRNHAKRITALEQSRKS